MSNTQLKGVVAHIVSHADGVVNDKAALTQRLTAMGAAVAGRFSGLVTHIIFRRKPQANREERLAEDQALWDLYTRIGKAAQQSKVAAQTWIVEPFWIEACFSSQMRAPEKPYLLLRPDSLLHLPRTKTPGSSAGKKRRRHIQQPKPVQKYDLDVAAFEFSSTQKMHDDEPLQNTSTLRRDGAYEQALQLEDYPGSAGSVPALPNDQVIDLTATRPSSAPSHLESSQVAVDAEREAREQTQRNAVTAAPSLSPVSLPQCRAPPGQCERAPAQPDQPATAAMERDATGRHSLAGPDGAQRQQLHGIEDVLTRNSLLGISADPARLHGADTQPLSPATLGLEATRGLQTPIAASRPAYTPHAQASSGRCFPQQRQQRNAEQGTPLSRNGPPQKLPVVSGLSGVQSLLRTPTFLNRSSPLQPSVLPRLKHAAACAEAQKTPMLASKLSRSQQHLNHETPGIMSQQKQLAARDSTAKTGAHDRLYRADSAARAHMPMALTIPRLKSVPAACIGQSPLAFPALSPAAAQPACTPQIRPDQPASNSGRPSWPSVTPFVAQQTPKQASGRPLCMPVLQSSSPAQAAACQPQTDVSMQSVVVSKGLGFGSPLLIEDTPQDRHNPGRHKPAAASDYAEVPPLCSTPALVLCAERPSPAAAPEGAQATSGQYIASRAGLENMGVTTAVQHLPGSAAGEKTKPLQRTDTAQEHAPRQKERRRKVTAAQQENAGAAPQQAASHSAQRQPLAPNSTAALDNAEGSEESGRGRKRQRSEQQARKRAGGRKMQRLLGACMKTNQSDARERSHSASSMRGNGETQEESLGNTSGCSGRCQAASQHIASARGAAVLCLSSVSDAEGKAAAKAVKQLGGMRLCALGAEEHVTHLVMGSPRRTLKVLLAIAAGAWLLTPKWIEASLTAGMWLDEHNFQSETSFASAAARAREHAARGGEPLLAGRAVHIMKSACAKQSGDGAAALSSMALAHGAKVTGLRQCDVCIVCQGALPPDGSKCPLAVRESWLLDLAASFAVPELSDAYDARQPIHVKS